MANRGGQIKDTYRVPILSQRDWINALETPGIMVAEIYGSTFGPCNAFLPTIHNIMIQITDADKKIRWVSVNVAKLEQDIRQARLEELKKKREADEVQRRKVEMLDDGLRRDLNSRRMGGPGVGPSSSGAGSNSGAQGNSMDDDLPEESVTLPKLEEYTGYDHPRPVYVVFKDGEIVYRVNLPNPPMVRKILTSLVEGIPIDEDDLARMEMQSDNERLRQKETRRRQLEENRRKQRQEKNASRDPEEATKVLMNLGLRGYTRVPGTRPVLGVFANDGGDAIRRFNELLAEQDGGAEAEVDITQRPIDDYNALVAFTEVSNSAHSSFNFNSVFEFDPAQVLSIRASDSMDDENSHGPDCFKVLLFEVPVGDDPQKMTNEMLMTYATGAAFVHLRQGLDAAAAAVAAAAAAEQEKIQREKQQQQLLQQAQMQGPQAYALALAQVAAANQAAAEAEAANVPPHIGVSVTPCVTYELRNPRTGAITDRTCNLSCHVNLAKRRGKVARVKLHINAANIHFVDHAAATEYGALCYNGDDIAAEVGTPESAQPAPVTAPQPGVAGMPPGTPAGPAPVITLPPPPAGYHAVVWVRDVNTAGVWIPVDKTEVVRPPTSSGLFSAGQIAMDHHIFNTPVIVEQYAKLDREIRVTIHIAGTFDPTSPDRGLIAYGTCWLSQLHTGQPAQATEEGAAQGNAAFVQLVDAGPGTVSVEVPIENLALTSEGPAAIRPVVYQSLTGDVAYNVEEAQGLTPVKPFISLQAEALPPALPATRGSEKVRLVLKVAAASLTIPCEGLVLRSVNTGNWLVDPAIIHEDNQVAEFYCDAGLFTTDDVVELLAYEPGESGDPGDAIILGCSETFPIASVAPLEDTGAAPTGPRFVCTLKPVASSASRSLPHELTIAFDSHNLGKGRTALIQVDICNLPKSEKANKCDPIVCIYGLNSKGQFSVMYGNTEMQQNTCHPKFSSAIPVLCYEGNARSEEASKFKIVVLDVPQGEPSFELRNAEVLAEGTFTLTTNAEHVMSVPLRVPIRRPESDAKEEEKKEDKKEEKKAPVMLREAGRGCRAISLTISANQ